MDNITVSVNGNDVIVTYPSGETIDILTKGSEITFSRGVSTIATPTPIPPPPDTTPPEGITNLMNSSYDYSYIRWVWNNPPDSDFSYTIIYIDGVWAQNTSLQYHNATGFSGDQSHTISTHTVDTSGNINTTWVNHTAQTRSTGYPNWWNPLWSCRRNVTVTNNVSSALTDYPVYLEIAHNSNMTNDFSDIRFTTEDGSQELSYWIENKVDGTNATVWVKVPSMVASADTTIYIYYGNAGASSQSDGTGVMDWYDNFTGAHTLSDYTIEDVGSASAPSSWSINTGGGFLRQQSNIYYNGVANNIGSILKTGVDLSGFEVQMNIRPSDNDVSGIGFCYENSSSHYAFGFTNDYWFGSNTGSSRREIYRQVNAGSHSTIGSDTVSVPRPSTSAFVLRRFGGDNITVFMNGAEIFNGTDSNITSGDVGLFVNALQNGRFYPPFIVRKYVYPEPVALLGIQECI